MTKWISVKEKLPDFYEEVLVYTKARQRTVGYLNRYGWHVAEFENEKFDAMKKVTHWQKLPEKPEEQKAHE